MSIARLGYIGLSAQNPSDWVGFGEDLLGLQAETDAAGIVTLKMDDHPFRVTVEAGAEDKLAFIGWETEDAARYEAVLDRLNRAGCEVTAGDVAGAARREVTAYSTFSDPDGNPLEVYYGRTNLGKAFVSPQNVSEFLTGDMGLGHVVIPAPNTEQSRQFYKDVLGFGDSDDLTLPPPAEGAPEMRIVFMHADNPRHHSLALFNFPVPTGIVHLMFEVPSVDEVGACLDRITAAGVPLMATLGRHANDNMLSFYAIGPGGIAIEYGCEGAQHDWSTFTPTVSTVADVWGHAYQTPDLG